MAKHRPNQIQNAAAIGAIVKAGAGGVFEYLASGNTGESLKVQANGDISYQAPISIGASSAGYMNFNVATGELTLSALGITNVTTSTEPNLAGVVANEYAAGTEFQEGDTVIIPADGTAYMHNGGTAGTAADFVQITAPGTTDAAIRALFSAVNGISYNATTGQFTGVVDPVATNDLTVTAAGFNVRVATGQVVDTQNLVAGSTGGATEVTLQDLLDALGSQDVLPTNAANGDVLHYNGTSWVKATEKSEEFTPANGATTISLPTPPITAMLIKEFDNGIYQGLLPSGRLTGSTVTLPVTANGTDEFSYVYYTV